MNFILWICLIPTISSLPFDEINILSDKDCRIHDNNTMTREHAVLINFLSQDSCSVRISNPWSFDMQNGFGVFLPQPIDCSTTVTVECFPDGNSLKQSTPSPSPIQYTCHTRSSEIEIPCSSIRITFKRNENIQNTKRSTSVQVVALAKEPCTDRDLLFQCPQDYPNSCLDRKLRCNKQLECPSGADERNCQDLPSAGLSTSVIILVVFVSLFLLCMLSTVLICCCCRTACNAIIRRFHPTKNNKSIEKGEIAVVTGEDAGLIKGLTTPSVIEVLPRQYNEPAPLIIDSTKPVYPRLE